MNSWLKAKVVTMMMMTARWLLIEPRLEKGSRRLPGAF